MESCGPVSGAANGVAVRVGSHAAHLEPPEVERAPQEELVGDGHRLRVGVDAPQEAGVEGGLQGALLEKQRDVGLHLDVVLEEAHVAADARELLQFDFELDEMPKISIIV